MAIRLPKNARLFTDSLNWLNDMLNMMSVDVVTIPSEYRETVLSVKELLLDDCSGLAGSLLDFMISCAGVDYTIESSNAKLVELFNEWSQTLNKSYQTEGVHNIPIGLRALAKEYFRERWKGSSFLILRTLWEKQNGFYVPTKLAFVNGEDIVIPDNDDTTVSVGSEKYRLRVNERTTKALPSSKNEIIFVQKPYESWSSGYAMPFVVRRGVWRNLQLMKMLHTKGERFVAKALEYLLLMKKGTEALALTKEPNYIYSEAELKQIKDDFIKHVEETKTTAGVTPTYVANFDTLLEHLTPDYTKIINDALYSPIERKILAGLGLIDIIQGISSTRRESTLNPRPFMTEVNNGIEDFKMLVTDILQTIQDKNRKQHRKYSEETLVIHNTPVKAFLTDEIRTHLRSLYDRGCLSKRTYTEVVGDTDFDIEVDRRKTEAKNKIEKIMYPHIVQNQEGVGIDFTSDDVPVLKQLFKPPLPKPAPGAPTDNIPTSKTGIEKKNFTKAEEDDIDEEGGLFEAFSPEVTESYERIRIKDPNDFQKDFFRIISISKTKGIKAVIGRAKGSTSTTVQSYLFVKDDWTIAEAEEWVSQHRGSYEEGPYKTVQQLPPAVKKYPKGAQEVFKSAFNSALKQYGDETTAFKVAWAALKNWMKSHKGEEDAKE